MSRSSGRVCCYPPRSRVLAQDVTLLPPSGGSGGMWNVQNAIEYIYKAIANMAWFPDAPADGQIYVRQDGEWVLLDVDFDFDLTEIDGGVW